MFSVFTFATCRPYSDSNTLLISICTQSYARMQSQKERWSANDHHDKRTTAAGKKSKPQLQTPWQKTQLQGRTAAAKSLTKNHSCREKPHLQREIPAANPLTKTTAAGKKNYSCKHNSLTNALAATDAGKEESTASSSCCSGICTFNLRHTKGGPSLWHADVQMCSEEGLFVLFCLPSKHWGRSWMPLPWCSLWISATAASMADLQNEWFSQAASSTSYSSSRLPSSFTTSKNWQNPQQHRNKAQRQQTTLVSKVFEMLNKRIELLLRNPNLRGPFSDVLELQTLNFREPLLSFKP